MNLRISIFFKFEQIETFGTPEFSSHLSVYFIAFTAVLTDLKINSLVSNWLNNSAPNSFWKCLYVWRYQTSRIKSGSIIYIILSMESLIFYQKGWARPLWFPLLYIFDLRFHITICFVHKSLHLSFLFILMEIKSGVNRSMKVRIC